MNRVALFVVSGVAWALFLSTLLVAAVLVLARGPRVRVRDLPPGVEVDVSTGAAWAPCRRDGLSCEASLSSAEAAELYVRLRERSTARCWRRSGYLLRNSEVTLRITSFGVTAICVDEDCRGGEVTGCPEVP